jgi:flagellar M-ring protein FliF
MVAVLFLLIGLLAFGLVRRQKMAGEDEESLEPQLAVEDLLVSTQLEEAREEEAAALEEIDYHKENEVKKQIEKFVNEKPESVAALLRNWINVEEW